MYADVHSAHKNRLFPSLIVNRAMSKLSSLLAVGLAVCSGLATASPCERRAEFVRPASLDAERQPLVKPYVLNGIAVLAVRQHAQQEWLELAVDSVASAQRLLAADGARVQALGSAVLLACQGLDMRRQAKAVTPSPTSSVALW
jgi:hypothetical protein